MARRRCFIRERSGPSKRLRCGRGSQDAGVTAVVTIQPGDVVGIGIHTGAALRGYRIGQMARARGAYVVFGGVHATLFPDEAREYGGAPAVVTGDGDLVWSTVLDDCDAATPQPLYAGGRVAGDAFRPAGICCGG